MGVYVTKVLTKHDRMKEEEIRKARREGKVMRPLQQRLAIMRGLMREHRLGADVAFELVDKTQDVPFPEAAYLLDRKKNVISSHVSKSFDEEKADDVKIYKLGPDHYYRIHFDDDMKPRHRGDRPPKEFFIIMVLSVSVSIVLGIGLSLIILTWYMRRKARIAEDVMNKIKSGELHTRFPINQTDEAGLLMLKFNEMAGEIEGLVRNLKSTEEARTKLLQELAHDLRTPVASMKSIQEILFTKDDVLDSKEKEHLQTLAMREVSYFERLVEDLLFLSGVNDPRYTQRMVDVNLTSLIKEELEIFDVAGKNISINAEENLKIKGDLHLLHRLLKNALSNAVRHSRSLVHVELHKTDKGIVLEIRDDGPGFKEEDLKTFGEKKYSRALQNESDVHISVGLGSVIMKKIMSLHNGTLAIRNTGTGAELSFIFPQ